MQLQKFITCMQIEGLFPQFLLRELSKIFCGWLGDAVETEMQVTRLYKKSTFY